MFLLDDIIQIAESMSHAFNRNLIPFSLYQPGSPERRDPSQMHLLLILKELKETQEAKY